jgi:cell fate (sporulation/competence/biofilm development) regulator YlbF (YheA/YmcA/DUF963 family)
MVVCGPGFEVMSAIALDPVVLEKTRELCQSILAQPVMQAMRQNIHSFLTNEQARAQYESVMRKGRALHEKQHQSLPLTGEEINDFERSRDELLANPVAKRFIEAQEEMHHLRNSIHDYVSKTLELGRLPQPEDFASECCGGHGGGGCCEEDHDHEHEHPHHHPHGHGGCGCNH